MEKVNFKIRVCNPKESAEIQRILFKLGYCWGLKQKKVQYTNKVGLFFDIEDYSITHTEDLGWFKEYGDKEITLTKLKSKAFQTYLKRLMILHNLE